MKRLAVLGTLFAFAVISVFVALRVDQPRREVASSTSTIEPSVPTRSEMCTSEGRMIQPISPNDAGTAPPLRW